MGWGRSKEDPDRLSPLDAKTWFRRLPDELRTDLDGRLAWDAARSRMVRTRHWRRTLTDAAAMVLLFVAGDWLVPGPSGHARAAVVGLGVAALAFALRAGQLRTAALGTLSFFILLWVSRGTMTSVSVYLCFPFGCCCAYLGYRRQERGLE